MEKRERDGERKEVMKEREVGKEKRERYGER